MFPSISRADAHFHIVHMDLWGHYKTATFDNKHYFLTIVDGHSRYTWASLLKLKSKAVVAIKSFLSMVHKQFGVMVKIFRTNNSTEFFNSQCSTSRFSHTSSEQLCSYPSAEWGG